VKLSTLLNTVINGRFVEAATSSTILNPHFERLSRHCLLPEKMVYDFFLKVEEVNEW